MGTGLSMDDFARLKSLKDLTRFAARDWFLKKMEESGLQKVFQSASFIRIGDDDFLRTFEQLSGAKAVDIVDRNIDALFARCRGSSSYGSSAYSNGNSNEQWTNNSNSNSVSNWNSNSNTNSNNKWNAPPVAPVQSNT